MKLDFRLLVIDDQPGEIEDAIEMLCMDLEDKGFRLKVEIAPDISERGIDAYCQASGRNFDLAIIDYRLGGEDIDGALAASTVRRRLRYTDIIFYSTSPKNELAAKMAEHHVDGVFIASRGNDLDDVLCGIADTIVGKAVDLNHMRGIAIAEVAEMDLLMEEILAKAFASKNPAFVAKGRERIDSLRDNEKVRLDKLGKRVDAGDVIDIVTDNSIFSSNYKWQAVAKLGELALGKGSEPGAVFASYETEIIGKRNLLAHARAIMDDGVTASLQAIRPGKPSVKIDEAWMTEFRRQLTAQHDALRAICKAISGKCPA